MGKPSAPTPPDPQVTAQAQTSSNIDTAIANGYLNATNQNTPYGTVTYNQTGSQQVGNNQVPTFSSTTSLNPQYQGILDSQAKIGQQALDTGGTALSNAQKSLSAPLDLSGLPAMPTLDRNAYADQLMSRFNQDWNQQSSANDVKLANQGIGVGSEAYAADKRTLDNARNDASTQAFLNAGNVQSQQAQLGGQQRQQALSELLTQRNQPLNDLSSLLGFSPGIQTPNAPNFGGNVAGTDVAGITQNGFADQQANYQAQVSQQNALMSGLFGLGSAKILASDRRLKSNIRRIGRTQSGIPIYSYTKYGRHEIGVMAQDVEKTMPWLVFEMPNGFKAVNYMGLH